MRISAELRGILWMILCGMCFTAVAAIMRSLGTSIPPAESAFLRYILGLIFIIPMLKKFFAKKIDMRDWWAAFLRGCVHAFAIILWFYAIAHISIADVVAMGYMTPVWITVISVIFLGERIAFLRVGAIIMSLMGMMIIMRPGFRDLSDAHLAMLLVTIGFAVSYILAKELTKRHSSIDIVVFLSISVPIVLAPFAYIYWVSPTLIQLFVLFIVAAFATLGHYCMTQAFGLAPMSVTQPVVFLQLIWATLLGIVIFNDPFDLWILIGGLLIVCAITVIAVREARKKNA